MTYDAQGRRLLSNPLWKDYEFAEPAKGHPSTWDAEVKQLRAERDEIINKHSGLADKYAEAVDRVADLTAENERLRAFVSMYDDLREGIRELGVKRKPQIYPTILAMDAARAGLRTTALQKQEGGE